MTHALLAILSLLIVTLVCAGAGRAILRFVAPERRSGLEGFLFSVGIGLGALSYLVMALGLVGLLRSAAALVVVLALAVVSRREIAAALAEALSGLRHSRWPSAFGAIVGLPLTALGAFALIGALAPPSANDWDTLAYHFAVPALYIKWGAIRYVPFIPHSNLPFSMEMLYTLGLMFPAAGGMALAKLFHFAMGVLTALAIYTIGRKHFSPRAGLLGALVFASIPLIGWEATSGYIDLGAAFFVTLAALALLNHLEEGSRWGVLAAVSLGLAAATKTTALQFIPMAALWLLYNNLRKGSGVWHGLRSSIGFGLIAVLVSCPWYIKSWIHTGNPVYPFAYSVFGGMYWSSRLAEVYRASQLKFGMGSDFISFVLLPWNLAMNPGRFYDAPVAYVSIGPVFLAALPFFAAARCGRLKLRLLLALAAAGVIFWFFTSQQSRYLIPVMAMGAVTVGALIDELGGLRLARGFLVAAIAAGVGWGLYIGGPMAVSAAPGVTNPQEYLAETLDIYPACAYVNKNLPADAKIIFFGDTRGCYCRREYLWGDEIHHTLIPYDRFKNASEMTHFMREYGITHALVNWSNPTIREANPPKYLRLLRQAIQDGLLRPVFQAQSGRAMAVVLYSLTPPALPQPGLYAGRTK